MSPEWREDFKFAVSGANRLGLELCVENCAGWSSSGGPWNTVTNAMQRLTTSELRVTGPTNFNAALPQPTTTLIFPRDIAALPFPAPDDENIRMKDFSPVASASGGEQPGGKRTDGDAKTFVRLPLPKRGQPQLRNWNLKAVFRTHGKNHRRQRHSRTHRRDFGFRRRHHVSPVKPFAFGRKGSLVRAVSLGSQPVARVFGACSSTR